MIITLNDQLDNYVSDLASQRDALSVYPSRLYQNCMSLCRNQIWGRIFSFLPAVSKQAVALTCTAFHVCLKEEDERYINAIPRFLSECYVIIDTNVDPSSLKTKIKGGITFLLGHCYAKQSHLKVHEAFMQIVKTPQTFIFTEMSPHHFTKDAQLLTQAEQWSSERPTNKVFNSKLLDNAPQAISQELIRFLKKANCVSDIAISTTLIFLSLINEKNGQRFAQALLFFYHLLNINPQFALAPVLGMLASGQKRTKNFDKGTHKKTFLDPFRDELNSAERTLVAGFRDAAFFENEKKNKASLIAKIAKVFEPVTTTPPKHPCVLAQGEVGHFFPSNKAKDLGAGDPITLELSKKNIPYIALYPKEFLITMPTLQINARNDHKNICSAAEYEQNMQFYIEVDLQLALKEGKNQEYNNSNTFTPYLNEESTQEFLAFLKDETREKSAFRAWLLVGQAVRQYAWDKYNKQ